jgi:hypothetical protein
VQCRRVAALRRCAGVVVAVVVVVSVVVLVVCVCVSMPVMRAIVCLLYVSAVKHRRVAVLHVCPDANGVDRCRRCCRRRRFGSAARAGAPPPRV